MNANAARIDFSGGPRSVGIEELITAVGITLERSLLSTCPALACNGTAAVDCLLRAVGAALHGCPLGSAAP